MTARAGMPLKEDWLLALEAEVARTSNGRAGRKIGYSPTTVSQILSGKYAGNTAKVAAAVRGALMGEEVGCPVLGPLRRDRCLAEQRKPLAATNPARARIYRACRAGCPHSYLGGSHDQSEA